MTYTKTGLITFPYSAWDANVYSGVCVQDDDGTYRMIYTGYETIDVAYGPCIATSEDFITWVKPDLGQITYAGNTNNNIVIAYAKLLGVDLIRDGAGYVGLFNNNNVASAGALIYTSTDGETFSFVTVPFRDSTHGVHVEPKCIVFIGGEWRIYYTDGHALQARSIGYYSCATLGGTWVDQGTLASFTSPASTAQYYDMKIWDDGSGGYLACVPRYNQSTEVLGPLELYASSDGITWTYQEQLLANGGAGEFDDGLMSVGRPINVNGVEQLIYAASPDTHATLATIRFAGSEQGGGGPLFIAMGRRNFR